MNNVAWQSNDSFDDQRIRLHRVAAASKKKKLSSAKLFTVANKYIQYSLDLLERHHHPPLKVLLCVELPVQADVPPFCLIVAIVQVRVHRGTLDPGRAYDMLVDEEQYRGPCDRDQDVPEIVAGEGR